MIQLRLQNRKVITVSKPLKQIASLDARLRMHIEGLPVLPSKYKTKMQIPKTRTSFDSVRSQKKDPDQLKDELEIYFNNLMKSNA